jgi:hypothetical protein
MIGAMTGLEALPNEMRKLVLTSDHKKGKAPSRPDFLHPKHVFDVYMASLIENLPDKI